MDGRTNESPSLTPRRLAVSVKFFLEMALALTCGPAWAWSHAGRFGSASGGGGSWSARTYRGGSASGGGGSWSAHGAYGGSASGGEGHWTATSPSGTTAYHTTGYGTTAYSTT